MGSDDKAGASEQPPSARPPPRRRWRLWTILGIFCALIAWFSHFAYLRITRVPTPRPQYWLGLLAALDPPRANAISTTEADNLLEINPPWAEARAPNQITDVMLDNVLKGPWDEARQDIAVVSAVVSTEAFADAADCIRAAADVGWFDDSSLGNRFWGPMLRGTNDWTAWLLARSRWFREHRGDTNAAAQDWITALVLARQLKRPRMVWPMFWSCGLDRIVAKEMMQAADELPGPVGAKELAAAINLIEGPVLTPGELLEGERLALHSALETFYVREGGDWLVVSDCAGIRWQMGGGASRIWNLASPLFHGLPTARAAVDQYVSAAGTFVNIAACQRAIDAPGEPYAALDLNALHGLEARHVCDLARVIQSYYEARCDLDAAVTMIALAEYRRRQGHYPQQLADLVPDFLPRLLLDCADMQPMRYRPGEGAYVLYSIGADGEDNCAGDGAVATSWSDTASMHDMVFSDVRRPPVPK